MRSLLAAAVGLVLTAAVAHGADSELRARTGDAKFDGILGRMNTAAQADPDGFLRDLSARHGIPLDDIRQARESFGLDAGGLYMASALARATQRPVLSVCEQYKKNEGQGWGVMAKEMGIKPGSREFHEMKSGAQKSLDHMRSENRARQKHEKQMKRESQGKGHGNPH